jgi:hypothetical protein
MSGPRNFHDLRLALVGCLDANIAIDLPHSGKHKTSFGSLSGRIFRPQHDLTLVSAIFAKRLFSAGTFAGILVNPRADKICAKFRVTQRGFGCGNYAIAHGENQE